MTETPVAFAARMIRALRWPDEKDYREAARRFRETYPEIADGVLDEIGSWTSSEPELAALQSIV